MFDHVTHPEILSHEVHIALVGLGGSGSQMLSGLARLNCAIRALNHPGLYVTAYDPDTVSEANIGRQLFAPVDVGQNKASVLVTRMNSWFGTRWDAVPAAFDPESYRPSRSAVMIVISCVDSARARVGIGKRISRLHTTPAYWMDLGNREADGQVILGIPPVDENHEAYAHRLPTVLELFPELQTAEKLLDRDPGPSCSLAQALERQELFVNQSVVTPALQLLWLLFRYGRTSWCGAFVNLKTGRQTALPVDPAAWARFGHHAEPTRRTMRCTVPGPSGEQVWIEKRVRMDSKRHAEIQAALEEEALA